MQPALTYLIGQPGAGKTLLLNTATRGQRRRLLTKPFGHMVYPIVDEVSVVQLGKPRETFGGTDSLAMNVQPQVVEQLRTGDWPLVFGEGDRLANGKFFQSVVDEGYKLTVVFLDTPNEVAEERREKRAKMGGWQLQDPKWVKGRRSKVAGLVAAWNDRVVTLDGNLSPGFNAGVLATLPVLDLLE